MADKSYDILINIDARVQAIQEAVTQTQRLVHEASGLQNAFGFAGIIELTHRLAEAVAEVPRALFEGVKAGVEFNSEIQDLQTNIAGILRLTQGEKFGNFAAAKAAAVDYIEVIKSSANTVGETYQTMFETVHETLAQLAAAGITDIDQAIQTALLLSQAMKAVGVSAQNASRDVGDLLQGNLQTQGGRRLASTLKLTTEELQHLVQSALQSGQAVQLLTTLFAPLAEAINDSSKNFGSDVNRMKNLLVDLESEAAKPIMEPLSNSINGAIDPAKIQGLKIIARTIGEIGAEAINATNKIVAVVTAIDNLSKSYTNVAGVLRLISQITPTGLAFHDSVANALKKSTTAVVSEDAEAAANKAKQSASGYVQTVEEGTKKLTEAEQKQADLLAKGNEQAKLIEATLSGDGPEVAARRAQAAYNKFIDDAKKLGPITSAQLDTAFKIYGATQRQTLAQFAHRDAAAASRAQAEAERDAHRDIAAYLREESTLLQANRQKQQLVEQNQFLTQGEKDSALSVLIPQEIDDINAKIAEGREALNGGALDPATYARTEEAVQQLQFQVDSLHLKLQGLSFGGQLQAQIVALESRLQLTGAKLGQVITGSVTTAIGGVSQGITNLITKAGTFAQAWNGALTSIIQQFVQLGIETAVYYGKMLVHMAVQRAAASANRAADVSEHVAAESTKASGSFLSALLTSISSYGYAAAIGLAAVVAAVAYFATSGFKSGGYTGGGGTSEIAGVVHGGEYVISAPAVKNLGGPAALDLLHSSALNNLTFKAPAVGGYAAGGFVSGSGGSSGGSLGGFNKTEVYVLIDEAEMQKRIINSDANEKQIIRVGSRAGLRRSS